MKSVEAPYLAKLKDLPNQPGVYFYYDKQGKIIYIGKAKVLRNRVKSYFTGTPDSAKTARLVARIWDLQTLVTRSEVEALLTEANLIKQHRPRFNIDLVDYSLMEMKFLKIPSDTVLGSQCNFLFL